jgi:S-adenosylmethionine uptake transporter
MVFASFWFATMALGIKYASASFHTAELVFYRGLVSVLFMACVVRVRGISVRSTVPMMHVWRTVFGVFALSLWFYAIAHLPLATAMTLNYMSAVWVAAFVVGGAMMYGQANRQGPLLFAVLMGFIGVVLTLRPTLDQNQLFAGLVGLVSGISAAMAYLQITGLGKAGEPEERTVFYFSIGTTLIGAIAMLFVEHTPFKEVDFQEACWVVLVGICATLGQWCMTRAYRKGATLVVASMQYSGIVFASLYGVLLFEDVIPPLGWAGIALIVTSGIVATLLRARALPHTPAEDH